jgi:hypothetical protein
VPVVVEAERPRPGLDALLQEADYVLTSAHFPQVSVTATAAVVAAAVIPEVAVGSAAAVAAAVGVEDHHVLTMISWLLVQF